MRVIYLAGPLFTEAERDWHRKTKRLLLEQAIVNAMVEMACDSIVNTQTALSGAVFGSDRVLDIGGEVRDSAGIERA
ncbi:MULTISPECIES: hypothetical protein [unclassified Thiocapsa]|uniref:hypothetical protein n=1 Tax=unclassified Thiocapsa TaxID=2641286 RepID=UPI0035AFA996